MEDVALVLLSQGRPHAHVADNGRHHARRKFRRSGMAARTVSSIPLLAFSTHGIVLRAVACGGGHPRGVFALVSILGRGSQGKEQGKEQQGQQYAHHGRSYFHSPPPVGPKGVKNRYVMPITQTLAFFLRANWRP